MFGDGYPSGAQRRVDVLASEDSAAMDLPSSFSGGWLYVRGNASVLIIKSDCGLLVRGPGVQREVYVADDEQAALLLHQKLETELRQRGWIFEGYGLERRHGQDRRRIPRWTERRYRWQN